MSFAGSFRVGQIVGGIAASCIKRVGLELGGKGPQLVFADADMAAATDIVARSIFGVAGQACISGSRLIVERLVETAKKVRVGDHSTSVPWSARLSTSTPRKGRALRWQGPA